MILHGSEYNDWFTVISARKNFSVPFSSNSGTVPEGQGRLIIEASRSHSDKPHSVGLPWPSDQLDAETST
jgi:hypothetical protein